MTRFGLVSDVHANLAALQATLQALERHGIDELLVAGDLVGYGGSPDECVEVLAEAGARCVAGNHDLYVLDRLPPTRFSDLARHSAAVTRQLISPTTRRFLAELPTELRIGPVLMTHGSLDSPEEYVWRPERAAELLDRMGAHAPDADTLVLGHTHRQWCVVAGEGPRTVQPTVDLGPGPRLLNPGSVGQSRQRERRPRARAAVYDSAAARVHFLAVDYDVAASLERLRELGLPGRCLHAPAPLRRRVTRFLRRQLRGARSAP